MVQRYKVIVSNVGNVHINSRDVAITCFNHYVEESKAGQGRVGGQSVILRDEQNNAVINSFEPVALLV